MPILSGRRRRRSILLDHATRKLAKRQPRLQIHNLIEIRLREDGQGIPCDPGIGVGHIRGLHALDEVRHGLEPALRDQLQRLARLERQAVARNRDFVDLARARQDVQA